MRSILLPQFRAHPLCAMAIERGSMRAPACGVGKKFPASGSRELSYSGMSNCPSEIDADSEQQGAVVVKRMLLVGGIGFFHNKSLNQIVYGKIQSFVFDSESG